MAKRGSKKAAGAGKRPDAAERLREALGKRTKGELIDILVELARDDRRVLRQLDGRFEPQASSKELIVATRQAIADATDFDKRDINRNFNYDYGAYEAIKHNLGRLIAQGQLREAMKLSLELMDKGSHQVEMSDEGLMAGEIEECLQVVIEALKKGDLAPGEVVAWSAKMLRRDHVGLICDQELQTLQRDVSKPGA